MEDGDNDLIGAMADCLNLLADDLEAEINHRYAGTEAYPSEARRKQRDLEAVQGARNLVARWQSRLSRSTGQ